MISNGANPNLRRTASWYDVLSMVVLLLNAVADNHVEDPDADVASKRALMVSKVVDDCWRALLRTLVIQARLATACALCVRVCCNMKLVCCVVSSDLLYAAMNSVAVVGRFLRMAGQRRRLSWESSSLSCGSMDWAGSADGGGVSICWCTMLSDTVSWSCNGVFAGRGWVVVL